MAEETEGSSYLAALKRGSSAHASSGAAPALSGDRAMPISGAAANAGLIASAAGVEKRRSARYKCDGSAEIRQEGVEVRTWATCTDISVNGCYLETSATYPADTVLRLRIEVSNFRFQTHGKVCVAYPQVGMGIEFTRMTEEERGHLKEMLRTLSRPSIVMGSPVPVANRLDSMPQVSDAKAAVLALTRFFEERQMLTRGEFILLLRRSQELGNGSRQ
jgi:hypothetical protein